MRKFLLMQLSVVFAVTAACTASQEKVETSNAEPSPPVNVRNRLENSPPPKPVAESAEAANSESGPTPEVSPTITNARNSRLANRRERMRSGNLAASSNSAASVPSAARLSRPAPDDSEFYSVLTDVAIETRVFHSHPQLARVERINDGRHQTIKVYLRNGRIIQLPGDRFTSIANVPAAEIVEALGIKTDASVKP